MSGQNPFHKVGSAFVVTFCPNQGCDERSLDREAVSELSPKLASLFSAPVIFTANPDSPAIAIYSSAWWHSLLPKFWRLPKMNGFARQFLTTILRYQIYSPVSDRLIFPESLIGYASISSEVRLLSFDDNYAELWSEPQLTGA